MHHFSLFSEYFDIHVQYILIFFLELGKPVTILDLFFIPLLM